MLLCNCLLLFIFFFFFKQKTAYEMRISDWSSDVCSSDLAVRSSQLERADPVRFRGDAGNLDDTGCIRHDGLPARPAGWDSASAVMHQRSTPSARNASIRWSVKPSTSCSPSSVCSPSQGADRKSTRLNPSH